MKKAIVLLFSVLLLFAAGAAIASHHVDGTWVLSVDLGGQGGDATFKLAEEDGGKVTGTYQGQLGDAEVSGTVDGNSIAFSFESQAGTVTYKGTISGDEMEGTCDYGQVGEGTFKGKKSS